MQQTADSNSEQGIPLSAFARQSSDENEEHILLVDEFTRKHGVLALSCDAASERKSRCDQYAAAAAAAAALSDPIVGIVLRTYCS